MQACNKVHSYVKEALQNWKGLPHVMVSREHKISLVLGEVDQRACGSHIGR